MLVRVTPIGHQAAVEARPFGRRHDEGQVVEQVIRFATAGSETELRLRKVGHGAPRRPRRSAQVMPQTVRPSEAPQIRSALCRCRLEEATM